MNENSRKWVSALRSGEYSQDRSYLRTDKGFCCLGVACDVYSKETGEGEWNEVGGMDKLHEYKYNFNIDVNPYVKGLPSEVAYWLGLRTVRGSMYGIEGEYGEWLEPSSLAVRNDDGSTFSEIADIIESEPRGLFNE